MAYLNANIPIITLSVNGLNTWIKRDWQSGLKKKKNMAQQYAVYKIHLKYNNIGRLRAKE